MSVARLDVGQRVYVLRDESYGAILLWGTVVRLRFAGGAWVRLDRRHERCPFPADDETRSTWVLTYADCCSSVEPPSCRRCSECTRQPHHWLTSMPEFEPADGGEPYIPCKHCDARAGICGECAEGPVWPPTTNNQRCELCNAPEGV